MQHFYTRQWKGLLWQKQQLQREEQVASTEFVLTVRDKSWVLMCKTIETKLTAAIFNDFSTVCTMKCEHRKAELIFGPLCRKNCTIVLFHQQVYQTRWRNFVSQLLIFINKKAKSLQIFRKTFIKPLWLYHSTQTYGFYKNAGYSGL